MKIFRKIKYNNTGRRDILLFGIKIYSYKSKNYKPVDWAPIEQYIKSVLKNTKSNSKKLIVVPSDPIDAYDKKGQEDLEHYYNPKNMFDHVFVISPIEHGISFKHGMHIIGVDKMGDCYKQALQLIKPDIVRAYGGYWATEFIVNNRTTNCPIIASVHDKREECLYDEIKNVDKVICVSETVVDLVKKRGVNKNDIILMYDRVDRNIFKKVKSDILDKNNYNIVCVARLSPEKNQETIIRALPLLGKKYHCTFIGQGEPKKYIKLAKSVGVHNQISFIPRVPNSDLPKYYSAANCMCVPSFCEGFGIVFIEAASCECPVVTSDISPMNIYLKNNHSAMLVKEFTNPSELAKAIKSVCENNKLSQKLGKNGRKATVLFDKKKIESQEAKIYNSLIK